MNPYLIFVITVLLLGFLLELIASLLNLRSLNPELPPEFIGVYDEEAYRDSQNYTRATTRFSLVNDSFMLVVTVIFILGGGFNLIDLAARSYGLGPIATGLLFSGLLSLLFMLINLPFSIYSTFVIEEKFGFNKTTAKTYVLDQIKGIVLTVFIGGPLLAAILWFFHVVGKLAWLYCWGTVTVFILAFQFLAPILIMPLFNKFTPIEDGELKERISGYAHNQHFAIRGIYTMDGSKRSSKLNAFFTGFGRFRRIVFFDTLIGTLNPSEVLAVLAHEMGHYKEKHVFKMMTASILQMGIMFSLLSLFMNNRQLFDAFSMEHLSIYGSLFFFGFLYSPLSTLFGLAINHFSRRNEYDADRWAVTTTKEPGALISGLKKLSVHNLSNLTPHPFNIFLHYSHPPVLARIKAIKDLEKQ